MTTLILVRHGQSEANKMLAFAGHYDAPLTDLGYRQAEAASGYIKAHYTPSKVYSSDLSRAYNTGKTIAEKLNIPIVKNEMLREIMAGDWEGKKLSFLQSEYAHDYNMWLTDIGNAACTNGEKIADLAKRVQSALVTIAEENPSGTVVIATHATPVRAMLTLVQKGNLNYMKDIPWAPNASISVLQYDEGKWNFTLVGCEEHLEGIKSEIPPNV